MELYINQYTDDNKEVFKHIIDSKLALPYEISNYGRVRYILSSGEYNYLETKDDGMGDSRIILLILPSYEFVVYSVNALIEQAFGKKD